MISLQHETETTPLHGLPTLRLFVALERRSGAETLPEVLDRNGAESVMTRKYGRYERHGEAVNGVASIELRTWRSMIQRCYTPTDGNYKYYGARGISVCPEWRASVATFVRDVGRRPGDGYSLDRVNNNGNYEPGNVKWSTQMEQTQNKRNNKLNSEAVKVIVFLARRYKGRVGGYVRLAAVYNIHRSTISHILSGKRWTNVTQ